MTKQQIDIDKLLRLPPSNFIKEELNVIKDFSQTISFEDRLFILSAHLLVLNMSSLIYHQFEHQTSIRLCLCMNDRQ